MLSKHGERALLHCKDINWNTANMLYISLQILEKQWYIIVPNYRYNTRNIYDNVRYMFSIFKHSFLDIRSRGCHMSAANESTLHPSSQFVKLKPL